MDMEHYLVSNFQCDFWLYLMWNCFRSTHPWFRLRSLPPDSIPLEFRARINWLTDKTCRPYRGFEFLRKFVALIFISDYWTEIWKRVKSVDNGPGESWWITPLCRTVFHFDFWFKKRDLLSNLWVPKHLTKNRHWC